MGKLDRNAIFTLIIALCIFYSCTNHKVAPPKQELVNTPEQLNESIPEVIGKIIDQIKENAGKTDSISILQPEALYFLYDKNSDQPKWSKEARWSSAGDSLIKFIANAKYFGLFPEDYHYKYISGINEQFERDSQSKKDAVLWSRADVLLTDALVQIIRDVKLGRLQRDSITLRSDSMLTMEFYEDQVNKVIGSVAVTRIIDSLEPAIKEYHDLKGAIKNFLDSAEFKQFTYVPFPVYDSASFKLALRKRLFEEKLLESVDSVSQSKLSEGIWKYQEKKNLKTDGKAGAETIRSLNLTDLDKFVRIALSLDKYKMLPAKMPDRYIWVNLAGYYMQLRENDSVKIYSRVVVGKPLTRTPELNSSISEMITYPQWSVPQSIIVKEFLPALKKNPGYLAKKGFSLLGDKNEELDPYFVDWSRFKTGIPYKIVQGSGDDNALGIMKFNFQNKYAVYLHDTNQRYLFAQPTRALSHGCVRVQEWQKLSSYILKNDSAYVKSLGNNSFTKTDSVLKWLNKKEKHYIPVKNKIPLFIRYFTCEGKDGKIVFYDDIYNEDRRLRERYFAGK